MIWLIISLIVIAIVANSTQDEIRFHWPRLFGKWFKPGTITEKWFNPSKSWENKYISQNKVLRYLFSTALVFTTDFWHLLKSIVLTFTSLAFLLVIFPDEKWWAYLISLVVFKLVWGIIYETTQAVYSSMADKYIK
jgi:hypothetical protein